VASPSYEIDGGIVFQANWVISGQLWRRTPDGAFSQIAPDQIYDRSPIVLPDGRIASVWSGSAETNGTGHIKIMEPDGSSYEMLTMPGRFAGVDDIVDSQHDAGLGVGFWPGTEAQPVPVGESILLLADTLHTVPDGYITVSVIADNFLGENIWYNWDTGSDTGITSRQPITLRMTDAGLQDITVTADNGLQQAAAQLSITVADEPWQVVLTADSNSGFAPVDVQFSVACRYQRDPVSLNTYDWDFGDGTVTFDGGPQIAHSYSAGGTFTATVTVTDLDGATKTESTTIQVTEPKVAASAAPLEGTAPLAVDFTATAEDFGGSDLTFVWEFGDGTTETGVQNVQHTYGAGGDYTAEVTVSDGHSEVTVETVVSVAEPLITLTASPAYGVAPFTVNLSTTDLNLEGNVTYTWSIDGGPGLSGGAVLVRDFASPGVYSVAVTADNGSNAAQDTIDIVVLDAPPTVEIRTDLTTGNAPLASFFDLQLEDWQLPVAVDWQVDGVTQGDKAWLAHTFAADGTFTVTATVTDSVFTKSETVSVVVGGRPDAQHALGPQGGTVRAGRCDILSASRRRRHHHGFLADGDLRVRHRFLAAGRGHGRVEPALPL
jgi:PKD repeat protein